MALFKPTPLKIEYTPGTHVNEFDGWRGISVSGVMLFHFFPTLFGGGWMCMEVFFVLSDFLITGILLDTRARKGYYKKFIGRRIVRIFPTLTGEALGRFRQQFLSLLSGPQRREPG